MFDFLGDRRRHFLDVAVKDTLQWCAGPAGKVGKKPTDQFWMQQFATDAPPICKDIVHSFLITFRLTNRVKWDLAMVVGLIEALRIKSDFAPLTHIPGLAEALRMANARGHRQTSAASKLTNFIFPGAEIYIWDELATRSVRCREWSEAGRKGRLPTGLFMQDGAHDYHAYHAACRRAFARELAQEDFRKAAHQVLESLRAIPGPLADEAVPEAFFQRRLLDKLMFHEGWSLKYDKLPTLD